MVSFSTLLSAGGLAFAALAAAQPTVMSTRRADTSCGPLPDLPTPGIRKPANDTTFTYPSEEVDRFRRINIKIIYCSGEYFKTSSLNATALLRDGGGLGSGSGGMVLGWATPRDDAADGSYYGYIFNVTIGPLNGLLSIFGPQQLRSSKLHRVSFADHVASFRLKF